MISLFVNKLFVFHHGIQYTDCLLNLKNTWNGLKIFMRICTHVSEIGLDKLEHRENEIELLLHTFLLGNNRILSQAPGALVVYECCT